ncbi:uncharacterized protein LOC132613235 [Lycium barbarum]|uniref:uncharacterized protein LOC132613235 n=1 Tax=Lycium barbarum TaxID=112863 RepID=UPI00293F11EE|nr:uncharacterized protein LOC132613235 [Lycium barbarum]
MSTDYQAWVVIKKGPKPIPNSEAKNDKEKLDEISFDMTKGQQEVITTNARAIALLYCAVSGEEYSKISNCETAKEMWDKLEVTYEGTSTVRENKIDALHHEYENFMMKEDENIESMFSRFSKIICELKSLGVVYSNSQQVRKLVRSLPKSWETKAIVLEDVKLDKMTYDELRENLMTFEKNHINRHQKEEKKVVESDDDDFKEEEVALISRPIAEAMRRSRNNRRISSNSLKGKSSTDQQKNDGKCYECEKYGHIASECSKSRRKPSRNYKKQRAFNSWSEDKISENEDDVENVYFMAFGETSEVRPYPCAKCNETQEVLDQTHEDLDRVFDEFRKLQREKKDWYIKLQICDIEKHLIQEEICDLQLQINSLRKSTIHSSVRSNQSTHSCKSTRKKPMSDNSDNSGKLKYLEKKDQ